MGARLLDLVDRFLHLVVEVGAQADERVEGRALAVQEQRSLGLDQLAGHVEAFEVDLGLGLVLDLAVSTLVLREGSGGGEAKDSDQGPII